MRRPARVLTVLVAVSVLAACGSAGRSSSGTGSGPTATIIVNGPFAAQPFIATSMRRGADLAVAELNDKGGIDVGGKKVRLAVEQLDSGLSPTTATANMRTAASRNAVAVLDEGTGIEASSAAAAEAGIPVGIVVQGGISLVDREMRPNVYRIAPTDRGISFRFAEYLVPKGLRVALMHDDSSYGSNGGQALTKAFARNPEAISAAITVPASAGDPAPQVLEARRSGATALLIWARPGVVAQVVRAARSTGWNVPIYSATSAEDPLVRQQLSDHPEWLDGLVFASARLTSERGPEPFTRFRKMYEDRFGPEEVGVRSGGKKVVQPPDWAMYSYDFVHVVAAAVTAAGDAAPGPKLVAAMEQVEVQGANGDERSFNERNHEGVVDDDIFFAVFRDMIWEPVEDDPLSASLPPIPQTIGR